MTSRTVVFIKLAALPAALGLAFPAHAAPFETDSWKGAWDTQLTVGTGIRLSKSDPGLTGDTTLNGGANTPAWSAGDNGNLNYKQGQAFSGYLKITSELLAHNDATGIDIMARGTAFADPVANETKRTELSGSARAQVVYNAQLLDFWAGHKFSIDDTQWRARVGNQVINWGESMYLFGGINASSAIDYQKSLIPGTQIKEYVLPAPLVSVAGQLGGGWNADAYYQFHWNKNKYPAVGSYWSTADYFGRGAPDAVTFDANNYNATGIDAATIARLAGNTGRLSSALLAQINSDILAGKYAGDASNPVLGAGVLGDKKPNNAGQYGLALHRKAEGSVVDYGLYYLHYTDKSPVFSFVGDPSASAGVDYQASYLKNRQLFGASTNFPLGPWAIGAELSYRPRDAVALSGCFTPGSALDANTNASPVASLDCPLYKDLKKYETHVTAQLTLTPSDNPIIMGMLKADSATLTVEGVATYYSGLKSTMTQTVEGVQVSQAPAAGYITWLDKSGTLVSVGTPISTGAIVDFNGTYDGSLINGWQVTAGATYFRALSGYTPSFSANYLKGAQSINYYVLFNQNPTVWQAGLNATFFFGGDRVGAQPYKDRDLVGAFVTRNF